MFAWLQRFMREHELPEDPKKPVRVDFIGKVVSPNVVKSPVSDFVSSLIEIGLYDYEMRSDPEIFGRRVSAEREHFDLLGALQFGSVVIEDMNGRKLLVEDAVTVIPLSDRPMPLDVPLEDELAEIAKKSRHLLMVRETRFRESDTVRVRATVEMRERVVADGYRDRLERVLVPVAGEPIVLREML